MKRVFTGVVWLSLLAGVALSAGAAELPKVLILNYPQEEALRQQMTAQAIKGLADAGFTDKQNVEIITSSRSDFEEEMAFVAQTQPAVVIDFSYRIQEDVKRFAQMDVGIDQSGHDEQVRGVEAPGAPAPPQRGGGRALGRIVAGMVADQPGDAAVLDEQRAPVEPGVFAQPAGIVDLEFHSHSMVPGGLVVMS